MEAAMVGFETKIEIHPKLCPTMLREQQRVISAY